MRYWRAPYVRRPVLAEDFALLVYRKVFRLARGKVALLH